MPKPKLGKIRYQNYIKEFGANILKDYDNVLFCIS